METKELKFKRDTQLRKQSFVPDSFAHPAKMDAQLLIWLIENYTKPGETVLDPMAGCGTTMLGCGLGRNCILGELEGKFIKMCSDNLEKVRMNPQLGYQMGDCHIIQGDARQLEGVLVDKCIFSPPYTNRMDGGMRGSQAGMVPYTDEAPDSWFTQRDQNNIGNLPYGQIDKIVTSPPFGSLEQRGGGLNKDPKFEAGCKWDGYSINPDNLGNLPYGNIDNIITSPPYEGSDVSQTHMTSNKRGDPSDPNYRPSWKKKLAQGYAQSKRPYHEVDSIITSPPYEGALTSSSQHGNTGIATDNPKLADTGRYKAENENNIGNLKSKSYLEAMLQVYQQCHKVLKPSGLMILVTKNFIRNKQVIRLDLDTIKLCEQTGFILLERLYRRLPAQSFWRVIYHQKYPEVETINYEDILVFRKDQL